MERQFRPLVFRRLERQQDASPEQQFDQGRQVGLQIAELPLPEHSSEPHVPGMGVVSVRYLQQDEPTAGEKNTASGEKNTAAGEESGAAVGAFLKISSKKYTKWLDYDKIIQSVVFRTRRSGDYLTIDDNFSKKSLKKYMIEEKIPANERNSMMVLADGNHIIWVPGGRISTYYRVTEQTRGDFGSYLYGEARIEQKTKEDLGMAERVEVMLSEEEVDRRIQEIGEQISKDYAGKQVHLVCVLKGGSFSYVNWQSGLPFRYPWISCRYPATAVIPNQAELLRS